MKTITTWHIVTHYGFDYIVATHDAEIWFASSWTKYYYNGYVIDTNNPTVEVGDDWCVELDRTATKNISGDRYTFQHEYKELTILDKFAPDSWFRKLCKWVAK